MSGERTHHYRKRWWPLLAFYPVFSLLLLLRSSWTTAVVYGAVGAWFLLAAWFQTRRVGGLTLGPGGLLIDRLEVRWSEIDRIERRRGRGDVFVLSDPLVPPKWVSPLRVKVIPLSLYDRRWRHGPIGDDIRRWAPQLL